MRALSMDLTGQLSNPSERLARLLFILTNLVKDQEVP